MSNIKVFVSNRIDLESEQFESEILIPIRCGAVFDKRENIELLGDDSGDNISERRMSFCELTVQYWAWKNAKADYYGLLHYRRFFNFTKYYYPEDAYSNVTDTKINEDAARTYGINDKTMRALIEQYDLILPMPHDITKLPEHPKTMREQWCQAKDLHKDDLDIMLAAIKKLCPEYYTAAQQYLDGKIAYWCLIYVMKKELFFAYCEWLYPLLFEIEQNLDVSTYSEEGQRTIGHLAERLYGIYMTKLLRDHPELRVKELQTVVFFQPQKEQKMLKPAVSRSDVKEKIPVVFAASDVFAPICGIAIQSVIMHATEENFYDIIVIETEIAEKNKQLIKSLAKEVDNVSVRFFNVQGRISAYNLRANEHISVETFYRFLIQDILPDYDKVLYLDSDLVCNRDVADLFNTNIEGYMVAAALDPDMAGQSNLSDFDRTRYLLKVVHMEDPFSYFQAGVLLFNTKEMRAAHSMGEWLSFAQKGYRFLDQDVLNRYCQGHVKFLDMAWNVLIDCNNYRVPTIINAAPGDIKRAYQEARKDPYIVHFAGFQKPWNQRDVDFEEFFWKYARSTPFYEGLLFSINRSIVNVVAPPPIGVKGALVIYFKKHCPKFLMPFAKKVKRFLKW